MFRDAFFRALGVGKEKLKSVTLPLAKEENFKLESIKKPQSVPLPVVTDEELKLKSLKKPPTGYLTFLSEFRANTKDQSMTSLVKAGSEKWRQLPEDVRQTYNESARLQREAWREKVLKLKDDPALREAIEEVALAAKQKRHKRALRRAVQAKEQLEEETCKPKMYTHPLGLFMKEKFPEYREQRPQEKPMQLSTLIVEEWKTLPEETKAKYKEASEKLKNDYLEAVSKWKEDLLASSKSEELEKLSEKVRKERKKSQKKLMKPNET